MESDATPAETVQIDLDEETWAVLLQTPIPQEPAVQLLPTKPSIHAANASTLIDYLHHVMMFFSSGEYRSDATRKAISRLILRLVQQTNMLPSGLFVNGVQLYSRDAVDAGGFGDIFQGSYHGQEVALKRFRIFSRDRVIIHRRIYRELLLWQTLNHPNVLPFIGVDASSFESMICAVSPWMHGGSLSNYRARFEPTPSDINALLLEAALGMDYLHSLSIVHGDLRCTNILVDRDGHAKLADFGLSVIIIGEMGTATTSNGSYRWAAPELFATGDVHRTVQSDVYAFGCVCLEAHTGLPPFAEIANEFKVVLQLTSGARPCRPDYNQSRLVSEHLWTLVERCWNVKADLRPASVVVVEELRHILVSSIELEDGASVTTVSRKHLEQFNDTTASNEAVDPHNLIPTMQPDTEAENRHFNWPDSEGQIANRQDMQPADAVALLAELRHMVFQIGHKTSDMLVALCSAVPELTASLVVDLFVLHSGNARSLLENFMEELLRSFRTTTTEMKLPDSTRDIVSRALVELTIRFDTFPQSLLITGVKFDLDKCHDTGSFSDSYKGTYKGLTVAIKRMRHGILGQNPVRLKKRFFREIFVWQSLSHENVLPFLGVDRQLFPEELCTVSPWMSNGDLCEYIRNHALDPSVVNQLLFDCATGLQYLHSCDVIHGDLRASNVLIAPNGRALLTDFSLSHVVAEAGVVLTSESAYSFIRWNAPEYFREGVLVKTSMGDVYSFGCVCLEAYTLNHPFPETRNKARVLWLVLQGVKPGSDVRDNPERFGISAQLWSLMEECWDADPSQRPTAEDLVESLRGVTRSPPKVGDVEESEGANQSLQDRTRT